jgi:hypothetical protein
MSRLSLLTYGVLLLVSGSAAAQAPAPATPPGKIAPAPAPQAKSPTVAESGGGQVCTDDTGEFAGEEWPAYGHCFRHRLFAKWCCRDKEAYGDDYGWHPHHRFGRKQYEQSDDFDDCYEGRNAFSQIPSRPCSRCQHH